MVRDEEMLRPGERIDDLQCGGYRLIQRRDAFCFGTDSVLLADFCRPRPGTRAVDLGCGSGAIMTLMAAHEPLLQVDGIEIQPEIADMARRGIRLNGLEERLRVWEMDMRVAAAKLGYGAYSLAVCNPPYSRQGAAIESKGKLKRVARHEGALSPEECALAASRLLKNGGRFAVIYPAPRAYEMMRAMERANLAPKRICTVHGVAGRPPKFVLMDAVKGGGSQLDWLEPLVLRDVDGNYSAQWRRIYRMGEGSET